MRREQQRLADYLGHLLEAIERIDRYTDAMDERAFLENPMVQDAVIRNFEIIGEASHNIEDPAALMPFASATAALPREGGDLDVVIDRDAPAT